MNKNVKIAKELVKLAKILVASEGYSMTCSNCSVMMDSYEQGTSGSPSSKSMNMSVHDETLSGCIRKAVESCGFTVDDVDYIGVDGDGILLLRFILNEDGEIPSNEASWTTRRAR